MWGEEEANWKKFGFTRMQYGNCFAMCGQEVAKLKLADLGVSIDQEAVQMIKIRYVDDGSGGGYQDTVDRLVGMEVTNNNGNRTYTGTISQIFTLAGFDIEVIIQDSETRPEILKMLGWGVLGLSLVPATNTIIMHLDVNISQQKANVRLGPELTIDFIYKLDSTEMTHRHDVSQIYSIYDPLGLLTPISILIH